MDFNVMTTDDLLAALPPAEDDRWEVKSAELLKKHNRGELKKELGKQVSAFANTGGGYLVLGVSNARILEACEQTVGRQPMKDYLATMVEQSVEYPIRSFRIHRIPFNDNSENAVFVIAIEDSPAAPHQAKDERTYFYRIDGHSKPAPHFHVELLRNRMTKALLEIIDVNEHLQSAGFDDGQPWLIISLQVVVRNNSFQAATSWGLHTESIDGGYSWTLKDKQHIDLSEGVWSHGDPSVLLPSESAVVALEITGKPYGYTGACCEKEAIHRIWEHFAVCIRAVSQNQVGEDRLHQATGTDRTQWIASKQQRLREIERALEQNRKSG